MAEKTKLRRFGRFWWLWLIVAMLSHMLGATFPGNQEIFPRSLINLGISIPLLVLGYLLYFKALKVDEIALEGKSNAFALKHPWPKAAVFLGVLAIIELTIGIPLFAFQMFPCSFFDILRKMNGCQFRLRHTSSVLSVDFSGDGTRLATVELDGPVRLWSYPDGDLLLTLNGSWRGTPKVALSSDARLLAVGSSSGAVDIYQADTGELLHQLVRKNKGSGEVAFASGDDYVLSVSDDAIQVWDTQSGELVRTLEQDGVSALAVFPDGDIFASASHFGEIKLWRLADGSNISVLQYSGFQDLAFSEDGKYLVTVGIDSETSKKPGVWKGVDIRWNSLINVWNIADNSVEREIFYPNAALRTLALTSDSRVLVTGESHCYRTRYGNIFGPQCVQSWLLREDTDERPLYVPFGAKSLAFAPTDGKLAIGTFENVFIWQVP